MSEVIPPDEDRFFSNICGLYQFFQGLVTELYNKKLTLLNPHIIALGYAFIRSKDKITLIENFIDKTYSYWDLIKNREETFFQDKAFEVFKDLPVDKVNDVKDLFIKKDPEGNSIISKDERIVIWKYFDSLIKICIKYIHNKRGPIIKIVHIEETETKEEKKLYKNKLYMNVPIKKLTISWNIKGLEWKKEE